VADAVSRLNLLIPAVEAHVINASLEPSILAGLWDVRLKLGFAHEGLRAWAEAHRLASDGK
jgi:hypothetical protein